MLQKLQEIRDSKKDGDGFTIIEVMIVLAIAGLILVVVLIAVPQLQRAQRNEARRSTLNRVSTEVGNYITNNAGVVPTNDDSGAQAFVDGFQTRYITNAPAGTFDTPGGGSYTYEIYASDTTIAEDTIYYNAGGICEGELPSGSGNSRNYAIAVGLEGGAAFCVDNQ